MGVEINWIAVLVAAISTMVVGSLWYGPLFGKVWARLAKVKKDPNFTAGKAAILYGGALLVSFVTAVVLAIFTTIVADYFDTNYLWSALWTGLILWAGFTAARITMHDSFEGRRKKLTLLSVSHELVTIEVMALIIGLWPVA
ncbi:MAG: hypothetical protein JWM52_729 [Candidatus Saccharibacteria bacterium]|nr:hypothetical protein [Candidatus Saccharibacteria bacterium]